MSALADGFSGLGRFGISMVRNFGAAGMLFAACLRCLGRPSRYLHESLEQARRIAVDGVGLVLLMGALGGSVMAQQTGYQLTTGLPLTLVAGGVVAGMLTELGPVMTAIVLAGRMGAGIGAELATMKVTNQIDALLTLGRDPVVELVVPRVIAGTIMMVPLVILANAIGILSGWLTAITALPMTTAEYVEGARGYYHTAALVFSLVKALFFGFAVTFIACYVGLRAEGGAAAVGRTATQDVVAIIVAIMALDAILAPVYKAVS